MYKILDIFGVGDEYCVSVEGNPLLLKNGISLVDENGNSFIIKSIGMVNYKNVNDCKKYAELILKGNIQDIGKQLYIVN